MRWLIHKCSLLSLFLCGSKLAIAPGKLHWFHFCLSSVPQEDETPRLGLEPGLLSSIWKGLFQGIKEQDHFGRCWETPCSVLGRNNGVFCVWLLEQKGICWVRSKHFPCPRSEPSTSPLALPPDRGDAMASGRVRDISQVFSLTEWCYLWWFLYLVIQE